MEQCLIFLCADTCDSAWQGTRDNLIIAAFVFPIFAILSIAIATLDLVYSCKYRQCYYHYESDTNFLQGARVCMIVCIRLCTLLLSLHSLIIAMSGRSSRKVL